MRKLMLPALLLLPALAQAHPGHGGDAGFIAGVMHPLTGLDHLLGIVAAGALLGWLPQRRRWLVCGGFLGLLGAAHALWLPEGQGGAFIGGLLAASAALVAAGVLVTGAATRFFRPAAAAKR